MKRIGKGKKTEDLEYSFYLTKKKKMERGTCKKYMVSKQLYFIPKRSSSTYALCNY